MKCWPPSHTQEEIDRPWDSWPARRAFRYLRPFDPDAEFENQVSLRLRQDASPAILQIAEGDVLHITHGDRLTRARVKSVTADEGWVNLLCEEEAADE